MAELKPKPLSLKRKFGKHSWDDVGPSDPSFAPTDTSSCKCSGFIWGQGVIVTEPPHIWALIKLGSHGKGMFSRSIPCHHDIPSSKELMQTSRKRRTGSEEVLTSWKKRIKLHSNWKSEQEDIKEQRCVTPTEECGESSEKDDDNEGDEFQGFVRRLKALKRKDPLVMEEYLKLGAEETFYLVAEAKVLSVTNRAGKELTEKDLWVYFSEQNHSFFARYVAYRHYKQGNWVPKSGFKFGVDFLLYKEGPLFNHSSYAVVVRESERNELTWKEVITFGRVSEGTRKDLLICQVTKPQGMIGDALKEPDCVDVVTIKDILVKRWVPEKDREI